VLEAKRREQEKTERPGSKKSLPETRALIYGKKSGLPPGQKEPG